MTSYRNSPNFDQLLRRVLYERVCKEEPAARIRLDVLCAAAANRALPIQSPLESDATGFLAAAGDGVESGRPSSLRSQLLVDMLSAQMIGARFAV